MFINQGNGLASLVLAAAVQVERQPALVYMVSCWECHAKMYMLWRDMLYFSRENYKDFAKLNFKSQTSSLVHPKQNPMSFLLLVRVVGCAQEFSWKFIALFEIVASSSWNKHRTVWGKSAIEGGSVACVHRPCLFRNAIRCCWSESWCRPYEILWKVVA